MKIPQEKFDEIAQANDIVDVVSGYLAVKKRGKTFLALCPFHPDKNPSLHISQEKQVYHCFSCKASGNVYTFVQNYEKITFLDAVKKLAERAGIELRFNAADPDLSNEISRLYEINKAAAKFFYRTMNNLTSGERDFIFGYLSGRKIDSKLVEKFGIGYSPKGWSGLLDHFLDEGKYSAKDLESAGLVIKSDKGDNKFYDRFRGRLMFPIFNESDKIVGFGGRKLYDDDVGGKYMNSPETKIYNKSRILYGLNFAKEKIRYFDHVILVEGYMDLIAMHKFGIENVVASSGTALTHDQVKLLSRYTKNVYVLFDSDLAGIKAAKRGIEIILEEGLDMNVITLPDGEDPDSYLNKYGKAEFEKFVSGKKSVINFIAELYEKEGGLQTVNDKTEFVKEIIGYVSKIPDKLKRAFYIKEIASMYNLYESDLRDALVDIKNTAISKTYKNSTLEIPQTSSGKDPDKGTINIEEQELIDLFINGDNEAIAYLENNLETGFIRNEMVLKIIEYCLDEYMNHGNIELSKALNDFEDPAIRELLTKSAMNKHEVSYYASEGHDRLITSSVEEKYNIKFAKDLIRKIRLRELEESRDRLKRDPDKILEVYELSKQINELKKST